MNDKVIILFFPSVNADDTRFIPFSILHLERMIRNKEYTVILIDEQTTKDYNQILQKHKEHIFIAALSATTGYQIKGAIEFSEKIKNVAPQAYTVWCGWHTSILPELTLKESFVDFVISGQPEIPFEKLTSALANNLPFDNISGLGYKKKQQLYFNPQENFHDINEFPEADYNLIKPENYVFENSFSKRCITYFASHGCPFQCEFCALATVYKGKWYHKNISQIIKDITFLKENGHIDGISFWDDNFFTGKSFALALCQALIENKINLKWECSTHAGLFNKLFNENDIALFYKSGLRQVFVGAESGDDEILDLVNKHLAVADNYLFAENLKKFNILPVFLVIVGFPVNPDKDLKATLNMIRKAKLINRKIKIRLHVFVPVPGTKMFNIASEKGLIMPNTLKDYIYFLYNFKPPWIKKDYKWQLEKFVNFYLPLANPFLYKEAPSASLKILTAILSNIFYPIAYLRLKFNFFKVPVGAYIFIFFLRFINKTFNKNLSLGSESYLDKNSLGFYNSYCG